MIAEENIVQNMQSIKQNIQNVQGYKSTISMSQVL